MASPPALVPATYHVRQSTPSRVARARACTRHPPQVGLIQSDMTPETRREAYVADVTYVTNSELGFDYLRDNLAGVRGAAHLGSSSSPAYDMSSL